MVNTEEQAHTKNATQIQNWHNVIFNLSPMPICFAILAYPASLKIGEAWTSGGVCMHEGSMFLIWIELNMKCDFLFSRRMWPVQLSFQMPNICSGVSISAIIISISFQKTAEACENIAFNLLFSSFAFIQWFWGLT